MYRTFTAVAVSAILSAAALAQTRPADDLASLREAVKTLKWQDVDPAQTSVLQRCRALLFMSHALGEIGAADATHADLLSEYIEAQQLGAEFVAAPPPPEPKLTFNDGLKMSLALLQGPLAQSPWATDLADSPENSLEAYEQLYQSTCQRKWAEVAEARQEICHMSSFLRTAGKLEGFNAWLPTAVEQRQRDHDAEMARRRAAYVAGDKAAEQRATELRQQQRERDEAAARNMDAALQTAQPLPTATAAGGGDDIDWYSGWYYGVLSNIRRGPYYRDAAGVGASRARTEERVSGWHAAGGRHR